ncbi:hypothetical protein Taro_036082 [Colocasia esculenta]|uniref:Transposase (putative) gypsy type domain-containing protein n=1 Tax=Colocasia esculenta TaxID=4460 RepID=A0A843VWD8_COLES|nr:hypothetical protein [Colocasia esculenta]
MPGSSCLLMMERMAWGGYNHGVSQRTCSAASGHTFRAVMAQKGKEIVEAIGMPPVGAKAARYRSFEGLRERFQIGEEYDIVLMREDESYLTTRPGCFVLSLDLLEAGLRLPMPEIAKELLRSWKVAPIQLTPNSWKTIFVFCIICKKGKIEATAEIFRNHFSLACSPQSGMGIVYVKHRTNRMRINFSPRLSNNKGWTGRLFFMGRRKGADIPEWDFPVRVVEPLRKADMAPFLIQGAAAASQSLNTVGVNHAEGYLTEYKLVKYKLSRAWAVDVVSRVGSAVIGRDGGQGELGRDLSFQDLPSERGAEVQVILHWSFPLCVLNHRVHAALEVDHTPQAPGELLFGSDGANARGAPAPAPRTGLDAIGAASLPAAPEASGGRESVDATNPPAALATEEPPGWWSSKLSLQGEADTCQLLHLPPKFCHFEGYCRRGGNWCRDVVINAWRGDGDVNRGGSPARVPS